MDNEIIKAEVAEDQNGEWGLYIIPYRPVEMCISEKELRSALEEIEYQKGLGS